jgi:hypothetical protein
MKRFVVGTSAVLAAMALALPAQASVIPQYAVSGSYSGTAALDNGGGCSFIHQTVSVTGNITPFGPTTSLALAYCVEFGSPYNVDGSYALATPDGTVGGALTGQIDATPNADGVFPYHFDLTVDTATGKFAGATGAMALDGVFSFLGDTTAGAASGTISFGPPIATARQDCANNGWRTMTDANGNPFKNVGQCVAFVSMHTP